MRELCLLMLSLSVFASGGFAEAANTPEAIEISRAKSELERIQKLVAGGGLPRNRLEEAQQALQEAEQQAFLRKTLFGAMKLDELTEPVTRQMLDSAKGLVGIQEQRLAVHEKLVTAGVVSRVSLDPVREELELRRKTLELAESNARLWNELAEMARAEQQKQLEAEQSEADEDDLVVAGVGTARIRQVEKAFETAFSRALPVSARGDTAFHRSMRLNHTGRVDVAVNPDSAEGQWLRHFLDKANIPYLAFRTAVPGAATAPHIHIGPPSTRLRTAD